MNISLILFKIIKRLKPFLIAAAVVVALFAVLRFIASYVPGKGVDVAETEMQAASAVSYRLEERLPEDEIALYDRCRRLVTELNEALSEDAEIADLIEKDALYKRSGYKIDRALLQEEMQRLNEKHPDGRFFLQSAEGVLSETDITPDAVAEIVFREDGYERRFTACVYFDDSGDRFFFTEMERGEFGAVR